MSIAEVLLDRYPKLNEEQKAIIGHTDGPLLVVAGPGSGKTFSVVLRALNLLIADHTEVLVLQSSSARLGWPAPDPSQEVDLV